MLALDALMALVPTELVSPDIARRLQQAGDRIPDALGTRVGLEARLGDETQVDLLLLANDRRQLGLLAGSDPTLRLPTALAEQAAWRRIGRLAARALAQPSGPGRIPAGIWLEFDVGDRDDPCDPNLGSLRAPGVFLAAAPDPGTDQLGVHQPGADQSGADQSGADQVCATIADILVTAEQDWPELAEAVRAVAGSGLAIRQVGMFPGRRRSALRLFCAAGVGPAFAAPRDDGPAFAAPRDDGPAFAAPRDQDTAVADVIGALSRAGWSGAWPSVEHWLRICAEHADTLHLSLDLYRGQIAPAIGIEASLGAAAQPRDDPRWDLLFSALQAHGLCRPDKRVGLRGLGREYEVDILSRRQFRQGLHHIKVQVAADGTARAKAYFGAYEVSDATRAASPPELASATGARGVGAP